MTAPFFFVEPERPTEFPKEALHPIGEIRRLLKQVGAERNRQEETQAKWIDAENALLAEIAGEAVRFQRFARERGESLRKEGLDEIDKALELFGKRWISLLQRYGVEARDPTGERLDGELDGNVDVEHCIPTPGADGRTVHETRRPIVTREGRLIQRGKVVARVPESTQEGGAS